jgi:hypothetical protein
MLDPVVSEERKSEPLYRDLSENNSAVQYLYRGYNDVDARSIAMSMIKRGEQKDATSLTEFSVSRHAVGREKRPVLIIY